jgi:hypothetical protein
MLINGLETSTGVLNGAEPNQQLPAGSRPILMNLLAEVARYGFKKVLLFAGNHADCVKDYLATNDVGHRLGLQIEVIVVVQELGTGGALWLARNHLDERFYMLNQDCRLDFNWLSLVAVDGADQAVATIQFRRLNNTGGYALAESDGSMVRHLLDRHNGCVPGDANSGVYLISRAIINQFIRRSTFVNYAVVEWFILWMQENDARRLDHHTLEALRERAVRKVQEGESPEVVARVLGLNRSTVYGWLVGAVSARRLGRLEGEAFVRASAETGWAVVAVDLWYRDAKEPAADEVRFRAVDPRDDRQIDQGQIQDRLEPCLGGAASGIACAIIELGGARTFVRGHRLGVLQSAAGLEIGGDASGAEGMAADLGARTELGGAALDQASTRCMAVAVSVPVRPAAERKRGVLPPSRMPAAST